MKNLGFKILIIGLSLLGLFVLGVIGISFLLGHEAGNLCEIEIQNKRNKELILKTSRYSHLKEETGVDTIYLKPNESLLIGVCFECTSIDTASLEINAIESIGTTNNFKKQGKKEILDYLQTKEKVDCATYLIY